MWRPLPIQVAYGQDGEPTKALAGFAAKNGVALEACTREADAKGVEYVWATTRQEGRHAAEVACLHLETLTLDQCHKTLLLHCAQAP